MSIVGVPGEGIGEEVGEIGIGIEWEGVVKEKFSKVSNKLGSGEDALGDGSRRF